jgi:cysteine desulfurase
LDQGVKKVMNSFEEVFWANPSSSHLLGRLVKEEITKARAKIARILNVKTDEIIFTNSGTEANNLAILGLARGLKKNVHGRQSAGHIITSTIEHQSVLKPCQQLEKEGYRVTYLKPRSDGLIDPADLKKALRPETILISLMLVNNEIGTIQPIQEIAKVIDDFRRSKAKQSLGVISSQSERSKISRSLQLLEMTKGWDMVEKTPFFHTDACQASGFLDLNIQKLGVDFLTLNGSKIYGPKGAGLLFQKKGMVVEPLIYGLGEQDLLVGLKNGSAIIGLAKALELAQAKKEKESARLNGLRDYLIKRILQEIPRTILNGPTGDQRIPNNINISFGGREAETLAIFLEQSGIYLSTTSACYSASAESYVVKEIANQERAKSALRMTLGRSTKKSDLDFLVEKLKNLLLQNRATGF